MKKLFLGTAVLAMLALVGCKKEQSQLDFEAIEGIATVQGKVTYVQGAVEKNGIIVDDNVAVKAGAEVLLSVAYKGYDSDAKGTKQFITTTDSEGKYKFEIPVGSIAVASTEATVEVLPFKATKGKNVDNKVVNIENALFDVNEYLNGATKNVALENKKIEVRDIKVKSNDELDSTIITNAKKFTVSGVLKLNAGLKWKESTVAAGTENNQIAPAEGTAIQVVLSHKTLGDNASKLTYTIKTGEKGAYSAEVAFFDAWAWEDVKVEIKAVPFYLDVKDAESKTFCYQNCFYSSEATNDPLTERLSGIYEEAKLDKKLSDEGKDLVAKTGLKLEDMTMSFKADKQVIKGYTLVKYLDGDTKRTYTGVNTYSEAVFSKNTSGADNQY